ncbi:efflux RND transporter periplasmic adaptor subunit [Rugamonas sp. FT82W]|uniref:Efflux RND transporter periplasmic adaptor subunit n=1 Tax=Duganella vulcania TaxID=2692166 RepID=A0A845FYR7_9BURK|nr:efflux RND transporter periplasmic adaptor subunit [Duganella vulcania]MYM85879.1 efflux RND transporter periplasmic adaptor subunit [Duganella vulcania]
MKSDFLNKLEHIFRQRWRMGLIAIIVMLAIVGMISHAGKTVPSVLPETAVVQRLDIAKFVHATGQLQPLVRVEIGAQVSGQVRQLHVQLGQAVKQGTLLVSLDSDSGRNAVQQAEAALAQQVAITKRSFIELQAARREAERQTRLLAGDATTSLDREKADTELAKSDAEHDAQQASLAQKRADLIDKQLKLTFTRVPAPIDGEVVSIAVQEGQTVNSLQTAPTLLTLAQLSRMTVKTRVAESEIGLVRVGQAARVTTLAADSRTYEGHVRVIQPIPERIGNAMFYNVLFDIDNADHHLLSDMTVQVELAVVRVGQVLALPIVALGQRDSNGRYIVQVLDSAGKVSQRKIHIGTRDDARVQVLDGVQLGERVLLAPSPTALTKAPQ